MRKKDFYKYCCFIVVFFSMFFIYDFSKIDLFAQGNGNGKIIQNEGSIPIHAGVFNDNTTLVIFKIIDITKINEPDEVRLIKDAFLYKIYLKDGKEEKLFMGTIRNGIYKFIFPTENLYKFRIEHINYVPTEVELTFKSSLDLKPQKVEIFMTPDRRSPDVPQSQDGGSVEINTEIDTTMEKPKQDTDSKDTEKDNEKDSRKENEDFKNKNSNDEQNIDETLELNSESQGIQISSNENQELNVNFNKKNDEIVNHTVIPSNIKDKVANLESSVPVFKNSKNSGVFEYIMKSTPIIFDIFLIIRLYLIKRRLSLLLKLVKRVNMRDFKI